MAPRTGAAAGLAIFWEDACLHFFSGRPFKGLYDHSQITPYRKNMDTRIKGKTLTIPSLIRGQSASQVLSLHPQVLLVVGIQYQHRTHLYSRVIISRAHHILVGFSLRLSGKMKQNVQIVTLQCSTLSSQLDSMPTYGWISGSNHGVPVCLVRRPPLSPLGRLRGPRRL